MARPRNEDLYDARRAALRRYAAEGLTHSECAARLGLTRQGLTMWFNTAGDEELRQRIKDNTRRTTLPKEDAIERLKAAIREPSAAAAARRLGLGRVTLRDWLRRNAPWGPEDALADYLDADEGVC